MRVLIVSLYFPPELHVAAGRIGHIAAEVTRRGHECYVVTRVPGMEGTETKYLSGVEVLSLPDLSDRVRSRLTDSSPTSGRVFEKKGFRAKIRRVVRAIVKKCASLVPPDQHIVWALLALKQVKTKHYDVVFATVPPLSSLLVANRVAKRTGAPLVVDFRDSVLNDPYDPIKGWTRMIRGLFQRILLRRATNLTAATKLLAEELNETTGIETTPIFNGFDSKLISHLASNSSRLSYERRLPIQLVYCGHLYPGKRDPSLLFEAIRTFELPVHFNYYGASGEYIQSLDSYSRVSKQVSMYGSVPHSEALLAQLNGDVLVHLGWNDSRAASVLSAKLLEYIGIGKPVLMVGYPGGEAAQLLEELGIGKVANSEREIHEFLLEVASGNWNDLSLPSGRDKMMEYSREEQSRRIVAILEKVASKTGPLS